MKVTAEIAAIRRTRPGVSLISPPPHHDIYSIEDLAQLIFSLRAVNPRASISVKCPAVSDLGTIAVGVAKAGADVIAISGYEGGTGAANASSIEHAGLPLELGVTDAHQALVLHGVRKAVKLRADGGLKTGADVAKLLALGADEVSLGTALMIAEQCIYCHGCSKGNCPSGITAGNDDHSRKLMQPKTAATRAALAIAEPDPAAAEMERYIDAKNSVHRYLISLAEDVRKHLAALGLRTCAELIGRVDLLEQIDPAEGRAQSVDLSGLLLDLSEVAAPPALPSCCTPSQLEEQLVAQARQKGELIYNGPITTAERSFGGRISGALAEHSLHLEHPPVLEVAGCAGQGFGFGLVKGLELRLRGHANDTVGAAMSGGRIVVVPPHEHDVGNSLIGNAAAYGATGGELFVAGRAGQRFGVRNSAATLVCEGAGKYAFEYMTGGTGAVLGPCGAAVGSGMTGGELFLLDGAQLHPDACWAPIDDEARARLLALLQAHYEATGSQIALQLLQQPERLRRAVPSS
jgi:glutamate synthase domain-containing protein 3